MQALNYNCMKHLGLKGGNLNWINKTCAIGGKLLWERCYQNKQVESCSHYEAVVLNTLGHLFCEFWLWIEKAHVQSIKFGIEWHLFGRWLRCICICIFMENVKSLVVLEYGLWEHLNSELFDNLMLMKWLRWKVLKMPGIGVFNLGKSWEAGLICVIIEDPGFAGLALRHFGIKAWLCMKVSWKALKTEFEFISNHVWRDVYVGKGDQILIWQSSNQSTAGRMEKNN